mmetsp:Transcript_18005/g.50769  ORF Transcript_18005/g.50769 Transcript_18005/m.50769 type:complete len:254 (-) Transcript_18005:2655-3416(-)
MQVQHAARARIEQFAHDDGGDVRRRDHRHRHVRAFQRGVHAQRGDGACGVQVVLHEVARAQVQQVDACERVQPLLLLVQAGDRPGAHRKLRTDAGQVDHPSHPRAHDRGSDRAAELRLRGAHVRGVVGGRDHHVGRLRTFERLRQKSGIARVADREMCAELLQRRESARVAADHADRLVALQQGARRARGDVAVGSHQDVHGDFLCGGGVRSRHVAVRISAIVDARFSLIVDGETASSRVRRGGAQAPGLNVP